MENKYDEHIQKLLDAGNVPGEWKDNKELRAYEGLFRLLKTEEPVEIPVNFSNNVIDAIIAKRERPVKYAFATLLCIFLLAGIVLFVSVYPSQAMVNIMQAVNEYKWAFLMALLVIGCFIITDYLKLKQITPPGNQAFK